MAEQDTGEELIYQAQSPDEAALVSAARNFGIAFVVSTSTAACYSPSLQSMLERHISGPPEPVRLVGLSSDQHSSHPHMFATMEVMWHVYPPYHTQSVKGTETTGSIKNCFRRSCILCCMPVGENSTLWEFLADIGHMYVRHCKMSAAI